jgi:hypothetical protein
MPGKTAEAVKALKAIAPWPEARPDSTAKKMMRGDRGAPANMSELVKVAK